MTSDESSAEVSECNDHDNLEKFEVEVEQLWTGTTVVEARTGEGAKEKVEELPDDEIWSNDLSPAEDVATRGVYNLDH